MILCNKISRASSPATGPTASGFTVPQSSASSPTTGTEVDPDTKARMAKKLLSLKKKKNTKACSQKLVKPKFPKSTPNTFC